MQHDLVRKIFSIIFNTKYRLSYTIIYCKFYVKWYVKKPDKVRGAFNKFQTLLYKHLKLS